MAAPILHHESWPLKKKILECHAPFFFKFKIFLRYKDICTINFTFLFLFASETAWEVFLFQTVGRVIVTWYSAIECILFSWGCVVKFQACEANSWRRSASSNPGNWVCVLSFFLPFFLSFFFSCSLSFLFFFSHLLLAFFHDQTRTLTQTRE